MNTLSVLITSLSLLIWIAPLGATQQNQGNITSPCAEAFSVRVNQSQIDKGIEAYAAAWIPVEISRDPESYECGHQVLISSGEELNWWLESGTQKLAVEPYDSRRNPLHIAPSGSGWLLRLTNDSAQDMFWLRVLDPTQSAPGNYSGYIELKESSRGLRSTEAHYITSTQFTYEIEPSVSMSFEGSWGTGEGTYFSVDMGDLTAGASKDFEMVLQSNTDVSVEVSSANSGYLKHQHNSEKKIHYNLNIQSTPINLASTSALPISFAGNYTNWRIPVTLNVPAVERTMLAGSYVDTIYVDVFPRQ